MQGYKTYNNGLFFTNPLARELASQVHRVKVIGKVSLIIVDGGLGEGKTTLAIHLGDEIMRCWFKDTKVLLDLEKQYAMGGNVFQEKLRICYDSQLPVIVYDEAGDFNTKGALTAFNRQLNRIFETFRAFKIIVILVLPSFDDVDKSLFKKKIVRFGINCYDRNLDYGNFRTYSLKKLYYLKWKLRTAKIGASVYNYETPNFYGHFLNLPKNRAGEIDKISMEGKLGIVTESIIKNKGLISFSDMSRKLHRSVSWCRQNVTLLKVKSVQTYKRKKFFDDEVLERLEVMKA